MTPYQFHKKKWKDCTRCDLHKGRNKIVLGSGTLPCDVLFIGEAPGVSEDVIGKPFVGPAGILLDRMIDASGFEGVTIAKTNLVACIPKDVGGNKLMEPPVKCINKCEERLNEFATLCYPKAVIYVGKLSRKYGWFPGRKFIARDIMHPAAILRMDISQKGLAIQRNMVTLREVTDSIVAGR